VCAGTGRGRPTSCGRGESRDQRSGRDADNRSTTARADIKVVSEEAVTWPDGSLGCPKPGMMYTQALVPGYRIVLQAGEQTLNYHAMSRGRPFYCPAGRVAPPVPASADPAS
jgi:hypothetical protein